MNTGKTQEHNGQINNPPLVKGFKINMPIHILDRSGEKVNFVSRQVSRDRKVYARTGIRHEVYHWLLENIGQTGNYVQWDEEDPTMAWLSTGFIEHSFEVIQKTGYRHSLVMYFRDKPSALLFKLRWWEKL